MKTKSKAVGTKEEPVWSSFWVQTWTVILMEKILFFKNSISLLSKGKYESMARSFMLAPPTPGPWNMGPFTSPHPWGHQDVHWYFMSLAIQMARTISLSLLTHHVSGLNLNDHPASLIVILNTILFPSLEHLTQDIIMHFYVWPLLLPDYERHSGAVINISILRVSDQYLAYHRHSASIYWMNEWSLCFDILFFLGLFVFFFFFGSIASVFMLHSMILVDMDFQGQESEGVWEMILVCNWPMKIKSWNELLVTNSLI